MIKIASNRIKHRESWIYVLPWELQKKGDISRCLELELNPKA